MFGDAGLRAHELTALCPECGATHTQEMNACPDCERPVVWMESKVWKRLHGKPADYLRMLKGEDLKPQTPFEMEVVRVFGHRGKFQNTTQQKTTRSLIRKLPVEFLSQMLTWAAGKSFTAWVHACENTDNLDSWRKRTEGDTPAWMRLGRGLG